MFKWYIPSFYGDIRLESVTTKQTKVVFWALTPTERKAMEALLNHSVSRWANWMTPALQENSLKKLATQTEQSFELAAPISKVQKLLTKSMKPSRALLSAVRFSGGKIEEVTSRLVTQFESTETLVTTEAAPPPPRPEAAVTVAVPVQGCPAPDFEQAEVRATAVLAVFLTPAQLEDFREHQSFIATGADTGHRYQLTSRHARVPLTDVRRTLYDLDEKRPYCVHDWEVPAAEELLSILMCLQLPQRERYLRAIPE